LHSLSFLPFLPYLAAPSHHSTVIVTLPCSVAKVVQALVSVQLEEAKVQIRVHSRNREKLDLRQAAFVADALDRRDPQSAVVVRVVSRCERDHVDRLSLLGFIGYIQKSNQELVSEQLQLMLVRHAIAMVAA
jgi:hypothetical protein